MTKSKDHTVAVTHDVLRQIGGSGCDAFNNRLANATLRTVPVSGEDGEAKDRGAQATLAAMAGAKPQSEMEGMLIAQMVAAHECAMACYGRAQITNQSFEGRDLNLRHAAKLSRAFTQLLETLDKHRGKGKQVIKVVHQHIYAKADGDVNVAGMVDRGAGDTSKIEDQPHEHESEPFEDQSALSYEPALRCPEPGREPVSSARDEG